MYSLFIPSVKKMWINAHFSQRTRCRKMTILQYGIIEHFIQWKTLHIIQKITKAEVGVHKLES